MMFAIIHKDLESKAPDWGGAKHYDIDGSPMVSIPSGVKTVDLRVIFDSGAIGTPLPVDGEGSGFYVAMGDLSEGEFVLMIEG